jgi:PTS system nitrogen regulatory IIA component
MLDQADSSIEAAQPSHGRPSPQLVLPRGLLSPERIVFSTSLQTADDVFERVGRLVHRPGGASAADVADRLRRRHARRSTAIGHGVALPHAEVTGLRSAVAVFLRSRHGLPFDAHDGAPVTDVLALVVPKPATSRHQDILSNLAALLSDAAFRDALAECGSVHAVWQLFVHCGTA